MVRPCNTTSCSAICCRMQWQPLLRMQDRNNGIAACLRPLVEAVEQDHAALAVQEPLEHALLGHGLAAGIEHPVEVQLGARLGPRRDEPPGHGLQAQLSLHSVQRHGQLSVVLSIDAHKLPGRCTPHLLVPPDDWGPGAWGHVVLWRVLVCIPPLGLIHARRRGHFFSR